jgi:hypothetical protein
VYPAHDVQSVIIEHGTDPLSSNIGMDRHHREFPNAGLVVKLHHDKAHNNGVGFGHEQRGVGLLEKLREIVLMAAWPVVCQSTSGPRILRTKRGSPRRRRG